jgi:hypothetical protein
VPACQHENTELRNEKAPTCTEPGYTGDTYCADCGELITAGEKIDATGHDYVEGVCGNCGHEDPDYVPENVVFVDVTADKDATNGVIVITWDPAKLTLIGYSVNADYSSVVEGEGTLTVGYISMYGIAAGDAIVELIFEAVNPDEEPEVTIFHEQINNEHFCNHDNTEIRNEKDVTCTVDGYTGDVYCADCDQLITEGEVITAPGHNYVDGVCEHCGKPETMMGDVNGDGFVDVEDAMLILQLDAFILEEGDLDVTVADVSGDGLVDVEDAMLILQFDAFLIDEFPAEN